MTKKDLQRSLRSRLLDLPSRKTEYDTLNPFHSRHTNVNRLRFVLMDRVLGFVFRGLGPGVESSILFGAPGGCRQKNRLRLPTTVHGSPPSIQTRPTSRGGQTKGTPLSRAPETTRWCLWRVPSSFAQGPCTDVTRGTHPAPVIRTLDEGLLHLSTAESVDGGFPHPS